MTTDEYLYPVDSGQDSAVDNIIQSLEDSILSTTDFPNTNVTDNPSTEETTEATMYTDSSSRTAATKTTLYTSSTVTSYSTTQRTSSTNPTYKSSTTMSSYSTTAFPLYTNTTVNTTTTVAPEGCPESYDWCSYTPVVYLSQFLAGVACVGVGYPIAQIMSYTLFSKILGPRPQAVWMGWLTAAGSAARAVGPVFVTQIYNGYGPRVTFSACCGILLITVLGICVTYKKLVPFRDEASKLISPVRNDNQRTVA